MDLLEAQHKYLGKMLRHKTQPFLLFAVNLYAFDGEIKAAFQHPHYQTIPKNQPLNATLNELENNWDVLG